MSNKPKTITTIKQMKEQGEPITMITAYDVAMARNVNEAGIDMILVGDSVGNVMLGYESTLPVTMDEMIHHTKSGNARQFNGSRGSRHAVHELSGRHGGSHA